MKCKYCGQSIPDNAKFCSFCGGSQKEKPEKDSIPSPELVLAPPLKEFENTTAKEDSETVQNEHSDRDIEPEVVQTSKADSETGNRPESSSAMTGAAEVKSLNGMAIAGFIVSFFFPIIGLIFSAIGLSQCNERKDGGKGFAVAGLVLSIIFLILRVIFWVIVIFVGRTSIRFIF